MLGLLLGVVVGRGAVDGGCGSGVGWWAWVVVGRGWW